MNNFLLLTKAFFLNGFAVNKKKQNQKSAFATFGGFAILILALASFYTWSMFISIEETGGSYQDVVIMMFAASTLITLIFSITKMQGSIFNTKDFELLESLPISKKTIVASKIASIFLFDLVEDLLMVLPSLVLYYVYTKDLFVLISGIIAGLFLSLIPLLVSTLIGATIAIITKNLKNKTLFETIGYLVFFIAVFAISFSMNNSVILSADTIVKFLPHLKLITSSFTNHEIYSLLIYLAINLVSFGLVILFVAKFYKSINLMHNKATDTTEYVQNNIVEYVPYKKTLEKKEMKMILGNAQWMTNSFIGPIFFLIMGIICLFVNFAPEESPEIAMEITKVMAYVIIGMGLLMNMTMTTTCAAFSLESSNFEMLLAYPIDPLDYINAKIKACLKINFILNLGSSVILVFLYSIFAGIGIIEVLEILLLPHLAYTYTCLVGVLCGLRWPKLEYDNEMQVIKQGAAAGFSMLFCFLPGFLLFGIIIAAGIVGQYVPELAFLKPIGFILVVIILVTVILIVKHAIKKSGRRMFRQVITR